MKMQAREPRAWTVDCDIDAYHAEREHESSSTLKLFRESRALYHERRVLGRIADVQTDPQRLGTLDHILTIEPHNFDKLVRVIPQDVLSKNGAKSGGKWDLWESENVGFLHVKQAEFELAKIAAERVRSNPAIRKYLDRATIFEQSIFWDDGNHLRKCRIDLGIEIDAEIIDVKRTCNFDKFEWAVQDNQYHAQAAMYCDGYEALYGVRPSFRFLLISSNACDCCITQPLPVELIDVGREMNAKALRELAECRAGQRPWLKDGFDKEREWDFPPHMTPQEPVNTGARYEH